MLSNYITTDEDLIKIMIKKYDKKIYDKKKFIDEIDEI